MDAEEVGDGEGRLMTSQVDDFTVATSLEDLEFGFSVTRNTQKVSPISICIESSGRGGGGNA